MDGDEQRRVLSKAAAVFIENLPAIGARGLAKIDRKKGRKSSKRVRLRARPGRLKRGRVAHSRVGAVRNRSTHWARVRPRAEA